MSKTYMEGKMKMDKWDLNDRVNDKGWNQKILHLLLSFSYFLNIKKKPMWKELRILSFQKHVKDKKEKLD